MINLLRIILALLVNPRQATGTNQKIEIDLGKKKY
jgi:hypothetical protein